MTKTTKALAAPAAAAPAIVGYVPGKYSPKAQTKWGAGNGNSTTYDALVAAHKAQGAPLTMAQVQAICKAQSHSGFVAYAINPKRAYLVPVTA